MNKTVSLNLLAALAAYSTAGVAADAAAGKAKAATCAGCHGADGNSTNPQYPSLAGKDAAALVSAMREYKSGKRANPIMQGMMKSLSDADMENVAAHYASLPAR